MECMIELRFCSDDFSSFHFNDPIVSPGLDYLGVEASHFEDFVYGFFVEFKSVGHD